MNNTSSSMCSIKPEFSVKIVVCDYYLAKPIPGIDVTYSDFRGNDVKQVPILRIFGSATDGQKACLHIHGVFPYFYIPCPSSNPEPQFLYQISASLDKALNIALKQATSTNQHVYRISLVKGLPFYGFHDKDHLYLKIFLYNPGLIKQAVELCSNAAILGQIFQPHESHLNFTLQFFIDFNLFGMSNIILQNVWFRKSGISQNSNEPFQQSSNDFNIKSESICYYEADCIASQIINRQRISRGDGIENPGLEEVWNQEMERRKKLNMSIVSKSLSQGRNQLEETESHYKFAQMFNLKISNLINKPISIDPKSYKNDLNYPAESIEGSQFFNAVEVSIHLPNNSILKTDIHESLTEDMHEAIVDESIALNTSMPMHYSQVLLNSEDLDLIDILQDMDENKVEDDSVIATPANADEESNDESNDFDYSQVFQDDTIHSNCCKSTDNDCKDPVQAWNDSFWDDANIVQLDGTPDDDHVKKVRKRKMRTLKLGLSKHRSNKTNKNATSAQIEEVTNLSENDERIDEINDSRETVNSVSSLHLRKSTKLNVENVSQNGDNCDDESESITNLVKIYATKSNNDIVNNSVTYDLSKKYKPVAGPSGIRNVNSQECYTDDAILNDSDNDFSESSPESDKLGILSFYDMSKIFDTSEGDGDVINNTIIEKHQVENKINTPINSQLYSKKEDDPCELRKEALIQSYDSTIVRLTPTMKAPTKKHVENTLSKYKFPKEKQTDPFFSDPKDVGDKVEIGETILKLQSKTVRDQKSYENVLSTTSIDEWRQLIFIQNNEMFKDDTKFEDLKSLLTGNKLCVLEPLKKPPTKKHVLKWLQIKDHDMRFMQTNDEVCVKNDEELDNSQAIGLCEDELNNTISLDNNDKEISNLTNTTNSLQVTMQHDGSFLCFGSTGNQDNDCIPDQPIVEVNFLTVMLLEVHTSVRGDLHPDPSVDSIKAVFITVTKDCLDHDLTKTTEVIVVDNMSTPKWLDRSVFNAHITYVDCENELIQKVIDLVKRYDPDIMCGYEIERNSWGYILDRSQVLGVDIVMEVSRITEKNRQKRWRSEETDYEGRIIGRVIFNVWRLFRHELALSSYSFENCMFEILNERIPKYNYAQLSEWWCHESRLLRWIPVEYYITRLSGTVRMLEKLDIINRTAELARLFGLQWWEVLSRGSQFRVESLMLRAARPLNLIPLSPTVKQRAAMKAPECLPLIFEPESRYYKDPVIVLDFQSLYPSMMIAYNYCFSTCIGRVQNVDGHTSYEFGAWRLRIPKAKLEALVANDLIHWCPVGVGFVKSSVRRGVLPALLRRILAARQAVKKNMKLQTDETIKKAMHSRQLGLKLIANVTYGYTAANFSGRMPCVELGDSVVAKGRETLERAIKLVRDSKQWNAKVVYGDTDSMFVLVPGGTRAQAFEIGQQIADAVTADNPSPVALKLEKVYQPCILQTKKRYVGYMYETPDQKKPVYEAKGIETVRRDGCPAGVKLLRQSLCELFDTGDVSRVKKLVVDTLSRLSEGSLPLRELFFTREYHGAAGYKAAAAAPPNEIAKRIMSRDHRAIPLRGERVQWLVTAGAPSEPLVRLARTPSELTARTHAYQPHVAYYATRALLPPLHRCFSLLGVNVFKWWNELNYKSSTVGGQMQHRAGGVCGAGGITRYMVASRCAGCGTRGVRAACAACTARPRPLAAALSARAHVHVAAREHCLEICSSCCGHNGPITCENTECPVLWRRLTAEHNIAQVKDVVLQLPSQFHVQHFDF